MLSHLLPSGGYVLMTCRDGADSREVKASREQELEQLEVENWIRLAAGDYIPGSVCIYKKV